MAASVVRALDVLPEAAFVASGHPGGPFAPARVAYVLTNATDEPVTWATGATAPWLSVYEGGGVLAPGAQQRVEVFPNHTAMSLTSGVYRADVIFYNVSQDSVALLHPATLNITVPAPGQVEFLEVALTNQLSLLLTGAEGSTYIAETATNFKAWDFFAKSVFTSEVARIPVPFSGEPRRFYRAYATGTNAVPARLLLTNVFELDVQTLRVNGDPGGTYLIESSADQAVWTPVVTNKMPASGSFLHTNTVAEGPTGLVYRATGLDAFARDPVHHVLIVGQSLAFGFGGDPALSTLADPGNYRLYSSGTDVSWTLLRELVYETIASSSARHVTAHHPGHPMVFSNTGVGGAVYELLKKGTQPYSVGIIQFRDGPQAASCALFDYRPSAIFVLHGEGDHTNPQYGQNIRQWQADYERDIRRVTGLEVSMPMFHSQASAWTSPGNGSATVTSGAFQVLAESESNPDRTILVCPKYMFPYKDGIHLTNTSYRWLGEYYARAYAKVVIEGERWTPLKPSVVTRSGVEVTAQFSVAVPPLVLDTNLVSDPGSFGFEYHDNSGSPPGIADVEIIGPDTVRLTLTGEPSGTGERLRYAFRGIPGNWGGPMTGPRGNLRDSDPAPSLFGNTLYNWCVHFNHPVQVQPPGP